MSKARFCDQCGCELSEESKFCPNCGAKIAEVRMNTSASESSFGNSTTGAQKKKSRLPIVIVVILAAAAVGFGALTEIKGGPGKAVESLVNMIPGNDDSKSANSSDGTGNVAETETENETESVTAEAVAEAVGEGDTADTAESENTASSDAAANYNSPTEFVEAVYNNYLFTGNIEEFWEDCVSQTTKDTGYTDKNTYVNAMKNNISSNNIVYDKIEISDTEDLGEGITVINGKITYTMNDEIVTEDFTDYVIEENGEYKYLLYGIKSVRKCTAQTADSLAMESLKIYTGVDFLYMEYDLKNNSDSQLYIGLANGSTFSVTMEDGTTFSNQFTNSFTINVGSTSSCNSTFMDASGTIVSFTIDSVYPTESTGLPITGQVRSVTYTIETAEQGL